jgi:hypothetical protein
MRVDPALDGAAPPLTQAHVTVRLRDGRTFTEMASGARGYPARPASDRELDERFVSCAARALSAGTAKDALAMIRDIRSADDVTDITRILRTL